MNTPNTMSLACSRCSLYVQQVDPEEKVKRILSTPCEGKGDHVHFLGKGIPCSLGVVWICQGCHVTHQPGRESVLKGLSDKCLGVPRFGKKHGKFLPLNDQSSGVRASFGDPEPGRYVVTAVPIM